MRKGFTLLELVLSVAIAVIVLLTIYSSFNLCLRVGERVKSNLETDALEILSGLSRDLRSAYLTIEKNSNLGFVGSSSTISFTTTASLRHNFSVPGEYDLREVGYYLTPSACEGMHSLMYRVDLNPGADILKGGQERVLTSQVVSLKFTYYDGEVWQEAWNAVDQLPQAVHISIAFKAKPDSLFSETFSTVVDIP